jgi:hypothetical protein
MILQDVIEMLDITEAQRIQILGPKLKAEIDKYLGD